MREGSVGAHSGTGLQPVMGCALGRRTPGSALQKYPLVSNLAIANFPKLTGWGMGVVSSYYRWKIYARPEAGEVFLSALHDIEGGGRDPESFPAGHFRRFRFSVKVKSSHWRDACPSRFAWNLETLNLEPAL